MKRIQRQRTKGWRMPEGAVYVGRPSRWGNPWKLGSLGGETDLEGNPWTPGDLVRWYRGWLINRLIKDSAFVEPLRGHDLVCWCLLDQPCHADVLLVAVA